MRALVIYCHPRGDSLTAAVRDRVVQALQGRGVETRVIDLYADGFDPVMSAAQHMVYEDKARNCTGIESYIADLEWCTVALFVFPTWWYGLPAMLKGWLDRVLLPGIAFHLPDAENLNIRPGLGHITHLGVFTTCGASRWLTFLVGAPGRKTLLRGLRFICARNCRTLFLAHYSIDSSTPLSRAAHLDRVTTRLERFLPPPRAEDLSGALATVPKDMP